METRRKFSKFHPIKKIMLLSSILVGLLVSLVYGQQLNCNALPEDTPCGPAFAGYPVNKTVTEFVTSLQNNVNNTNAVAQSLIRANICNQDVVTQIQKMRYQVSIQCAYVVNQAIRGGCPFPQNLPPKGPLLCPQQCDIAIQTQKNLFSNNTVCPSGSRIITQVFIDYCTFVNANLAANGNTCFAAAPDEQKFAGIESLKCDFLYRIWISFDCFHSMFYSPFL
jgi:hypothetical protein